MIVLTLLNSCEAPPSERIKQAMDQRTQSILTGAERWAKTEFETAEALREQAEGELSIQHQKLGIFRKYHAADSLFSLAAAGYRLAEQRVSDTLAVLKTEAELKLNVLEKELAAWRSHLDTSLVANGLERFWSGAEAKHTSAVALLNEHNYLEAIVQSEASRIDLDSLASLLLDYLKSEASQQSLWTDWIKKALAESAIKQNYAVIVDKTAHRTHLVHQGKVIKSFECDLGFRPARQKLFSGDGATPEGRYRVRTINNSSKYYRALVLDYPNEDDKARYSRNRKNGIIPNGRGIGSLIELHGHGGQDKDWTDGCVALADSDLDSLMKFVDVGTMVTIVRRWPDEIPR